MIINTSLILVDLMLTLNITQLLQIYIYIFIYLYKQDLYIPFKIHVTNNSRF